jgi:DHA1 family bicyclomycin/chloramphenicol resistance-like MFS transporter
MFSLLMLVIGVSPILAPLVGGQLLRVTSWHGTFWGLAGLGLLVLLAAAIGLPETLPAGRRKAGGPLESIRTFGRLLADRRFSGYAVTFGSAFAATFAYISASPFVFQGIYHVTPQVYGVLFGINGLGLIAGSQVNAAAVGRFALGRLLGLGLAVRVLGAFALLGVVLSGGLGLLGIMIPLVLVVGSNGLVAPNTTALALSRHPEAAGAASAVLGVLQFGVGALVAPLVGLGGAATALPMAVVLAGGGVVGVLSLMYIVGSRPAWLGGRLLS